MQPSQLTTDGPSANETVPPPPALTPSTATYAVSPDQFLGQWSTMASDPTIIRQGNLLRMFYTCIEVRFDLNPTNPAFRASICEATSTDGKTWQMPTAAPNETQGLRIRGIEGSTEENLEAALVLQVGSQLYLYYSGYTELGGNPSKGFPADLYLAISSDNGVTFTRRGKVLSRTPGGLDSDAVYSPTIIQEPDGFKMIYTGHCYLNCSTGWGANLLGATSTDGINWVKNSAPVMLAQSSLSWANEGVGESHLIKADGRYYLYFTGLAGEAREIGVASSDSPFGPWTVNSTPIFRITPPASYSYSALLAPTVLIENGKIRVWFLQIYNDDEGEKFMIRYAEGI